MRKIALLTLLVLAGCGAEHDLMPMAVGKKWTYTVDANFNSYNTEVRVSQKTGVAGVEGYVLTGPMGESRLAWKGDELVAERLINSRFEPAIPLVVENVSRVKRTWKGQLMGLWGKAEGTATLEQGPAEEQLGGRTVKVTKSVLTVISPNQTIKLQTMFQDGAGIATQRQWINGNLILKIERLSG